MRSLLLLFLLALGTWTWDENEPERTEEYLVYWASNTRCGVLIVDQPPTPDLIPDPEPGELVLVNVVAANEAGENRIEGWNLQCIPEWLRPQWNQRSNN